MEKSLLKYIWIHSNGLQAWILVAILVSIPLYFYSLGPPKQIINRPIQGKGFHSPTDARFIPAPLSPFSESLAGKPLILFPGFKLTRLSRFPIFRAKQAKRSKIAGIIKDEVDPLSDFIGDSYSARLFPSGRAITVLIFLFVQSFETGNFSGVRRRTEGVV